MSYVPFAEPEAGLRRRVVSPLSVVAGSLLAIFPLIASFPVLPPFGLMMLLAWRLRRHDALPIWSPLLLGLFDDLVSGQPLGSAVVLWTVSFFSIDLIERRLVFRDFWQDWLVAAGGIAVCLALGRLLASPLAADVDSLLLVQVAVSILLFPVVASVVSRLDRRQEPT